MTESSDRETAMLLGEFKAQIASLTKALEAQTQKAEDRGARMYKELESIRAEQAIMQRDLADVKESLKKADTTISELNRWRERGIGMISIIGFMGSLFGGGVVLIWKWLGAKFGI